MAGTNSGHLVDFLTDQLLADRTFRLSDRREHVKTVRAPPLVTPLYFNRFAIVKSIEPDFTSQILLRIPEAVRNKLRILQQEHLSQEQNQQPQQQSQYTVGKARQYDFPTTLSQLSCLDLERLDKAEVEALANAMKDVHVALHCKHVRNKFETTQLVAFCCYINENSPRPLTVLAKFAIHDASRVISHLVKIGAEIFTVDQIGVILKTMMLWVVEKPLDSQDRVEERLDRQSDLSRCGCLLLSTYLEVALRNHRTGDVTAEISARLNELKNIQDPGTESQLISAATRSVKSENDLQRMSNIIFSDQALNTIPEPFGWFLGILIEGSGQFVDHLKEQEDHDINATSSVLAFGFAIAGVIPFAGPFMGLVGLTADLALHHFWKSDDYRPLIRQLDGLVESRVVLQGEMVAAKEGLDVLKSKQHCDDMINAKKRTQNMGTHVSLHKNIGSRIKDRLHRL